MAEMHDVLAQMVAQAACNARDVTFKDEDIPKMAESMAKHYGDHIRMLHDAHLEDCVAYGEGQLCCVDKLRSGSGGG